MPCCAIAPDRPGRCRLVFVRSGPLGEKVAEQIDLSLVIARCPRTGGIPIDDDVFRSKGSSIQRGVFGAIVNGEIDVPVIGFFDHDAFFLDIRQGNHQFFFKRDILDLRFGDKIFLPRAEPKVL